MNKSRIFISLLLVLVTIVSIIPLAISADDSDAKDTPAVGEEALPEQFSLVGTVHLPPISNQGEIGSCASQSITYTQMTNAVSRYIHSIDPETDWNPSSGDPKYLMSSKFTYDFSGSGTAWVYDILVDHGCATMDYCAFETNRQGGYSIWFSKPAKVPNEKSTKWTVGKDEMLNALQYRLTNYEQIWARDIDAYVDGNLCLTTTENGKAFLDKIKSAVVAGNVVVTGGISGGWKYDTLKTASGTAKKGESALVYTVKGAGGHQLAIVGYDDNVVYDFEGGQMKGAFLVANSWAESWMNKGYIWVMYDSLNGVSEYEAFNSLHSGEERIPTMDQYVFTYWDKDIEIGLPELMVEVEVSCLNRENVAVYLTRNTETYYDIYTPKMFFYGKIGRNYHPKYDITEGFTFDGKVITSTVTKKKTAIFALKYSDLIDSIPEGKSFSDYTWGVNVYSVDNEPIIIKSISLINSQRQVISKIDIPEGGTEFTGTQRIDCTKFVFDYTNPTISVEENDTFTLEYTSTPAEYLGVGNDISFKVAPANGKEITSVSVDGNKIEAVDGVYTAKLSANTNIKVETADVTPEVTETPDVTAATTEPQPAKNDNSSTIVIIIIAVALVVVAAVVVLVVVKNKKKDA